MPPTPKCLSGPPPLVLPSSVFACKSRYVYIPSQVDKTVSRPSVLTTVRSPVVISKPSTPLLHTVNRAGDFRSPSSRVESSFIPLKNKSLQKPILSRSSYKSKNSALKVNLRSKPINKAEK